MSIDHALGFLSTPYESDPLGLDHAYAQALALTARLTVAQPLAIFSPVVFCHPIAVEAAKTGGPNPRDRGFWMGYLRPFMERSTFQVVATLPNWERSQGIAAETGYFERKGLPVFDLDPVTLSMTRRRRLKPPRERIDNRPHEEIEREAASFLADRH